MIRILFLLLFCCLISSCTTDSDFQSATDEVLVDQQIDLRGPCHCECPTYGQDWNFTWNDLGGCTFLLSAEFSTGYCVNFARVWRLEVHLIDDCNDGLVSRRSCIGLNRPSHCATPPLGSPGQTTVAFIDPNGNAYLASGKGILCKGNCYSYRANLQYRTDQFNHDCEDGWTTYCSYAGKLPKITLESCEPCG